MAVFNINFLDYSALKDKFFNKLQKCRIESFVKNNVRIE
jgi:hypothetical protein